MITWDKAVVSVRLGTRSTDTKVAGEFTLSVVEGNPARGANCVIIFNMKSVIGYLLLAIVVATVIGLSIVALNKSRSTSSTPVPIATQMNTPLPTATGVEPTESGCVQEGHIKSPSSFNAATITFDNQTAGNLKVYWLDFNGKRKFYSNLKANSKYDQKTWVGHVWVVADASDQCLKLESANAVSQIVVIN